MNIFNPFSIFEKDTGISADAVKHAIDAKEEVVLVDVRTPEEFAQGHISGSILLPLQDISKAVALLGNKDQKIYAYCRSGARSAQATQFLKSQGFTSVYSMSGGILAWMHKNYPLVTL